MKYLKCCIYLVYFLIVSCSVSGQDKSSELPIWTRDAISKYPSDRYAPHKIENRVMFDEDIRWALDKKYTDEIIKRLSKSGFNVYVPCVWHGRGTRYPSNNAHSDSMLSDRLSRGEDPLEYLIAVAHKYNIEVHPWFTVVLRDDDALPQFSESGTPRGAYNVHNKKFRDFAVDLMLEVVDKYNIDGINLDYIRSKGYCISIACEKSYEKEFSRNLQADLLLEKVPKIRIPSLMKWNGNAVDDIVGRFALEAKAKKPNLIISVDSMPGTREFEMQGHDSPSWVRKGWVDVIYYMLYQYDFDFSRVDMVTKQLAEFGEVIPILSLYNMETLESRSPNVLEESVNASRHVWPGLAFYHYKQLTQQQELRLRRGVYRQRAQTRW